MDDLKNIIIYRTADGRASVTFATSKQLISHHIANILKERELNEISVVKQYLTTAADGKNYNVFCSV